MPAVVGNQRGNHDCRGVVIVWELTPRLTVLLGAQECSQGGVETGAGPDPRLLISEPLWSSTSAW